MSKRISGCDTIQLSDWSHARLGSAVFMLVALIMLARCLPNDPKPGLQLHYIERFDIENKAADLREPSGLVLSRERDALWTVSDNTKQIFKITLQGTVAQADSFEIADKGLEGITLDPTGTFLLTVQEEENKIIKIEVNSQQVVEQRRLADMQGYAQVAAHFATGGKNKGLEGITWNSESGTIFVLKEGEPGLLVELSADLTTILDQKLLNAQNGFQDNDIANDKLDFSGLFYDETSQHFWIVSDQGQRLFVYDWRANRVLESMALAYGVDGQAREIEKAEGVAFDPLTSRLYVVSDAEARLYVFDVRK